MSVLFNPSVSDMRLDFGDPVPVRNMDQLSVMAWIKPVSWGETSRGVIVQKSDYPLTGWVLSMNDVSHTETFEFYRARSGIGTEVVAADYAISEGEWQHVAVAHKTDVTKLFVNGVETSYNQTTYGTLSFESDTGDDLRIGNNEFGTKGFSGEIEDVRVYDRYLSAAEIGQIATARGRDSVWQDKQVHCSLNQWAPGATIGSGSGAARDITNNKIDGTSLYSSTAGAEGILRSRRAK